MDEEYMLRQQWLNIILQYINRGLTIDSAIVEADKMVVAYRQTFPNTTQETD